MVAPMADSGGPYVMLAALCEQVIEAADGRISVINVVESVTHRRQGPDIPDEMPPFDLQIKSVIELVAGKAKGRYSVKVQPEDPSGAKMQAVEHTVRFGEGSGIRLIGDIQMKLEKEGLYWIDIVLVRGRGDNKAEELLTRMPLRVVYQPLVTTLGPGTQE
jgi:hypothetical protein